MRCALVIGHHSNSPGAENAERSLPEFEFNARLALDIWRRLRGSHDEPVLVFRRTYATLPEDVNAVDPVLVVSLHSNSFKEPKGSDWEASGTETLYHHRSKYGRKAAEIFQKKLVGVLELRNRGVKPITREDRGGKLLSEVDAPAILCEPFFIDNNDDLERARGVDLAGAFVDAIHEASVGDLRTL